jgi:hypothetical protein
MEVGGDGGGGVKPRRSCTSCGVARRLLEDRRVGAAGVCTGEGVICVGGTYCTKGSVATCTGGVSSSVISDWGEFVPSFSLANKSNILHNTIFVYNF